MRRLLRPPVTSPLPHGLQRGGVLDASWTPGTFKDVARYTVPTNSPAGMMVPENVFMQPVSFSPPDRTRMITGGPVSGLGQIIEPADRVPMPVAPYHVPMVPRGARKGGIFGRRRIVGYPVMYRGVPERKTTRVREMSGYGEYFQPQDYTTMSGAIFGFGRGPDGIGACGCNGAGGCGCR